VIAALHDVTDEAPARQRDPAMGASVGEGRHLAGFGPVEDDRFFEQGPLEELAPDLMRVCGDLPAATEPRHLCNPR
jgi:hypothetical protein